MTVFKPAELFERLRSGHSVVTGNSRLARVLANQYGHWCIDRGERQWASPPILSWNTWVGRLWEEAGLQGCKETDRAVPGGRQLLNLWETVLRDDQQAGLLLRPESLARQLVDTRRLLIEWKIDPGHPSWFADGGEGINENHAAFRRWNRAFESLCREQGWISPEERLSVLTEAVNDGGFRISSPLDLLGFDEFNPAQQDFLSALSRSGTSVDQVEMPSATGRASLWRSSDHRDETITMARWVRQVHEADTSARIAVVVPDLESRRSEIERQLAAVLVPGLDDPSARPWNISLGTPLSRVSVVEAAFDLLRLSTERIDIGDTGRFLRSPWIRGGVDERSSRALLEKLMRTEYPRQFRLGDLLYRAGEIRKKDRQGNELPEAEWEPRPWNSPAMARIIEDLLRFYRDRKPRLPSSWAESFESMLRTAGWPQGDGSIDAAERDRIWQTYHSWQDALREFSSLDVTSGKLALREAVNQLHGICRDTVFQPRTPPATIQVLGLYEVIGLRFNHLWVMGLHNDNWPAPSRRNPFIPVILQTGAGLPHSGPEREYEVAQTVTRRLLETAPDCIFSYPGQVDGEETLPSPLLITDGIASVNDVPAWAGKTWQDIVYSRGGAQTAPLEPPGPLTGRRARGGTSILRNQANCPFRAFAVNRLGAEGLATPANGITPMLHGSLVHKVLEYFWQEVRTLDALLDLGNDALAAKLQELAERVLDERHDMDTRPAFRDVESVRLQKLAADYLEIEKTRGPFEVTGFEQHIEYEIEGQAIHLVIDRIDRLPGGDEVIIDYKTGKVKPDKWFGDPPEEPQLPLYAVSADKAPVGVVYSIIREDGCEYRGVVQYEGIFPGLPPRETKATKWLIDAGRCLPETTVAWKAVLHRLMSEFLAGEAEIQPLHGRRSCHDVYCDLQPLCRIGELEQLREDREDAS
jgi:probable DNA repair protein